MKNNITNYFHITLKLMTFQEKLIF